MLNLKDPRLYINRELSWLRFNTRVLNQAQNQNLPSLERLKFLAIYGTNLDEFYMIRVAGLIKLYKMGLIETAGDQLTPLEQLKAIRLYILNEKKQVEEIFFNIKKELQEEKIILKEYHLLSDSQKENLYEYFLENIYPLIIPIAVDGTHPFPNFNNLSFGLIIKLYEKDGDENQFGMVRIPRALPRYIELDTGVYIPVEVVVAHHIEVLFPHHKLEKWAPFRVTRNADITIQEEEADDFMEIMQQGLKLRKRGELVRLEVGNRADDELLNFFIKHTKIYKDDVYIYDMLLNMGSFWQIVSDKNFAHLLTPPFIPKALPPFGRNDNIFDIIDNQDVLLYHPFESFEPVVEFIQTAAKDPDVVAIRMTLYRAGLNSPIINALMEASESGKQVTAMVELKARFDEENNLVWARALESSGAHVIYGITGFKVHAKTALVIKKVDGKLKQYCHLATGNYNPTTSKIYTDVSFFTIKEHITQDVTKFFHFLTGFYKQGELDGLFMSPTQIKPKLIEMIHKEIEMGSVGHIVLKANSLVDEDIIRSLYKASQAGVKVELIIRGICALRPNIKGVSENIRVISILGKYLEHARIYYFKHDKVKTYISSADLMPRNLSRRVELLTPIEDEALMNKLLQLLQLQLSDNVLSYELQDNGDYIKVKNNKSRIINNQQLIENYVNRINKAIKKETTSYVQQLASRLFKEN